MTHLLLSQRARNAREICARCSNRKGAGCRYPVVIEFLENPVGGMTIRTAKLIHFSEDGLTCQLFKEVKE